MQAWHGMVGDVAAKPGVHTVHLPTPWFGATLPSWHEVHALALPGVNWPGMHDWQDVAVATEEKNPGAQGWQDDLVKL